MNPNKRSPAIETLAGLALFAVVPLLAAAAAGCVKDKPITDITKCPCAPGWTCDPTADICIPDGVGGAPGAGGPAGTGGGLAGGGAAGTIATGVAGAAGSSPAGGAGGGLAVAVCGNGVREPGEACDDGNEHGADGCSAACAVEDGFVCNAGEAAACNRSCATLTGTECQGGDCCASLPVPGGTITYNSHSVTVPSFRLDKYEVTVARFRGFVAQMDAWQAAGNPAAGAGAHPDVPNSGWRPSWLTETTLVADGLKPVIALRNGPTTTSSPVYSAPGSDNLAVNWVPWHTAFAFCIWDGGRLPADVEWAYAGFRGEDQTRYSWGNTPSATEMFAPIPPAAPIPFYNDYPETDPLWRYVTIPVGSHPASGGRFGHQDLMAGLWEWVRDTGYDSGPNDFIQLGSDDKGTDTLLGGHKSRGGEWIQPAASYASFVKGGPPAGGSAGFRCARDVR